MEENIPNIQYQQDNGVKEEAVINKEYFSQVNNQQILTCCICEGLLNDPLMCSKCQTPFCKVCIKSWLLKSNVCPLQCKDPEFIEVSKVLKSLMDDLRIRCEICGKETTLFKYPQHRATCSKIKCFNCGSEVNYNKLKKVNERDDGRKQIGIVGKIPNKEITLPDEVKNDLVFHLYVETGTYKGFLSVNCDHNNYIELIQYRPNASIFKIVFINQKKCLKVYTSNRGWLYVGKDYEKAIRATSHENKMCCVKIDIEGKVIEEYDSKKNEQRCGLSFRKTNKKLYFYDKTDEYQKCEIELLFIGKYSE